MRPLFRRVGGKKREGGEGGKKKESRGGTKGREEGTREAGRKQEGRNYPEGPPYGEMDK